MNINKTISLIMDLQDKLTDGLEERKHLIESNCLWIRLCNLLGIPVMITEQVPEKLGHTNNQIIDVSSSPKIFRKNSFSAFGCDEFAEFIKRYEVNNIYLCGVETAICVYLTAIDALRADQSYNHRRLC